MNETVGYIFTCLHNSEKAIQKIANVINAQNKFNKSVARFALVSAACVTVQLIRTNQLERKIEALNKELEELKKEKGE